jgi:surface antigen
VATLLISDFRGKQLHANNDSNELIFITDDNAEYSWFSNSALKQLPLYSLNKANVIIMLGFNDCVYSCTLETFDINNIVSDYTNTINELIKDYPDYTFYVCSVPPIDADYPFAAHADKVIQLKDLDKKIKRFNDKLKEMCDAIFIDCYAYLNRIGFDTRDGVRLTPDSCENLLNYICSDLKTVSGISGTAFKPRTTAPVVDDQDLECDLFWLGDSYGGYNPFDNLGQKYAKCAGDTLPNCTSYAWGRFYEITGSRPTLSTSNAEQWFLKTSDGYKRGLEPALGAIICWQDGETSNGSDGAGHVAIVEQINPDGSIITSESGWDTAKYWWTKTRTKGADGNWGASSNYKFQGFIYCPTTTAVTESDICVKNSYNISLDEMKPNAQYIWNYLGTRGWTMNAVAGLLGNLQQESKMSPAVWESTIDGSTIKADGRQELNMAAIFSFYSSHNRYPGYGLVQWTPYYNFTNWCTSNKLLYWELSSQLARIIWETEYDLKHPNKGQWISRASKGYALSFHDFTTSTADASWLAEAFAFCYERPGRSTGTQAEQDALRKERGEYGTYWYNFLNNLAPITSNTKLFVENLKISKCESTAATVSFLTRNASKASYLLNTSTRKELQLTDDVVLFELQNLVPNKEYTLTLCITGTDETEITKKLVFTTPQAHPESFNELVLTATDTMLPHDSFKLKTTPAKPDFGYWNTNGHGYLVQLIVNGKVKSEKIVNSLQTIFKISDYFEYTPVLGDTIQIGIRTWVKDEKGKKVYNSDFTKCSNTVCMLASQTAIYINND